MKGTHLFLIVNTLQKHVTENGAPPDKFGALYHMFHMNSNFNIRIDVPGLSNVGFWY